MDVAGAPAAGLFGRVRARSAVRARREPRVIEAMVKRRGVQRLGQVCVLPTGSGRTVRTPVSEANVPLAVHGRHVPVVAQHGSDRGPVRLDHRIALGSIQHPVLQPVPPRVAARQQAVAGRRTPRRRSVGVGEADAHARQALHVRGVKLDLIRIACEILIRAGIAHPHVISHHEDDVGRFGGGIRAGNRGQSENHSENGGRSAHNSTTLRNVELRIPDKHAIAISEEAEYVNLGPMRRNAPRQTRIDIWIVAPTQSARGNRLRNFPPAPTDFGTDAERSRTGGH